MGPSVWQGLVEVELKTLRTSFRSAPTPKPRCSCGRGTPSWMGRGRGGLRIAAAVRVTPPAVLHQPAHRTPQPLSATGRATSAKQVLLGVEKLIEEQAQGLGAGKVLGFGACHGFLWQGHQRGPGLSTSQWHRGSKAGQVPCRPCLLDSINSQALREKREAPTCRGRQHQGHI